MRVALPWTVSHCLALAALAWGFAPGTASAGCGGVQGKFSEAASLCGAKPSEERDEALSPYIVVEAAADARPASVAIPLAGARLAAPRAGKRVSARSARAGGPLDGMIREVAADYRIAPRLLAAIVTAESNGRGSAVSHKGALGLMQVMPGTARQLGISDPSRLLSDDRLSLETGARYLKHLQGKFGNDVPIVVAAYNAGPGAVNRYGRKIPPYRETRGYVRKIMGLYRPDARRARR